MFAQSGARGADMLTRTTLVAGPDLPAASAPLPIAALRRVPGVLLADWQPAQGHTVVARSPMSDTRKAGRAC
jgi:hypothetical protein